MGRSVEQNDSMASVFLRNGYYVVNYKRHLVARFPLGKAPMVALAEATGNHAWAMMIGDTEAGHDFLQHHAFGYQKPTLMCELEPEVFEEFVALGGCTYREYKRQGSQLLPAEEILEEVEIDLCEEI